MERMQSGLTRLAHGSAMRVACMVVASLTLGACGGEDFDDCALGDLTGTWRWEYDETDGNCGAIPDETVSLSSTGGGEGCTFASMMTSSDQCRQDLDFTCPTTDGQGTQHWVMVMHHTDDGRLEATATVQLDHPSGTCRSTYDINIERL